MWVMYNEYSLEDGVYKSEDVLSIGVSILNLLVRYFAFTQFPRLLTGLGRIRKSGASHGGYSTGDERC